MAGFATDTTIDSVQVELPNGTYVNVRIEHDGVNPEPTVTAELEEDNECVAVPFSYSRRVLIDGTEERDEEP